MCCVLLRPCQDSYLNEYFKEMLPDQSYQRKIYASLTFLSEEITDLHAALLSDLQAERINFEVININDNYSFHIGTLANLRV